MSKPGYRIQEIEVVLTISDGKISAESRSGQKEGVIRLSTQDNRVVLALDGAGADEAKAMLSGPELSNFRTIVDATLADLDLNRAEVENDRRVLASGYQSLVRHEDGYAVTLDAEPLEGLGLLDDDGSIAGGGRQVRSTVLNSGSVIINLFTDDEVEFNF